MSQEKLDNTYKQHPHNHFFPLIENVLIVPSAWIVIYYCFYREWFIDSYKL